MKAVRLHEYHQQPVVEEVPEPTVKGPLDVVVKIGGAGVCRTDLHIIEGQWAERSNVTLPYTHRARERRLGARGRLGGDERRRRRHGDPAPDAHLRTVPGLPRRRRHALREQRRSPGSTRDGGMAELPAHVCARLRQARPCHAAGGRRSAGRRGHYGIPRRTQGDPAARTPVRRAW